MFSFSYPAGYGDRVVCLGQFESGEMGYFGFNTGNPFDRINPFSAPNSFMDKVENIFNGRK